VGDIRGRQRANRSASPGQVAEHVISHGDAQGVRGGVPLGLPVPPPLRLSIAPTGQSAPKPSQSGLVPLAAPAFWRLAPCGRESCQPDDAALCPTLEPGGAEAAARIGPPHEELVDYVVVDLESLPLHHPAVPAGVWTTARACKACKIAKDGLSAGPFVSLSGDRVGTAWGRVGDGPSKGMDDGSDRCAAAVPSSCVDRSA
jgi:hypothetical protein